MDILIERGYYPSFKELVFTASGELNRSYSGVSNGIYIQHLRQWLKYFPMQQIHIIDTSAFIEEPWLELNAMAKYLDIPATFLESDFEFDKIKHIYCKKPACTLDDRVHQHPLIPEDQLAKIRQFYHPYNEELYQVLQRDFHWQ